MRDLFQLPKMVGLAATAAIFCLSNITACSQQVELTHYTGSTMGTGYSIKFIDAPAALDHNLFKTKLESELEAINASMSTYREDSEISRFNQTRETTPFSISLRFETVIKEALRLSKLSDGAFDITIGPLVNLWGFGPTGSTNQPPDAKTIAAKLEHTGFNKLVFNSEIHTLSKTDPELYLDLSAIAKGYAVDRLSQILEEYNLQNYMVDIGGEVKTKGINAQSVPWTIAVEQPIVNTRQVLLAIQPMQAAVATSGDYRNYFENNGTRYSHTIDPRSGRPINHRLAAVTVITEQCMTADALATALMVLGPDDGFRFAQQQALAVLFVTKTDDGFKTSTTEQFKQYIMKSEPIH